MRRPRARAADDRCSCSLPVDDEGWRRVSMFDMVIVNGTAVIPRQGAVEVDLGIKDGSIAAIGRSLDAAAAEEAIT